MGSGHLIEAPRPYSESNFVWQPPLANLTWCKAHVVEAVFD